MKKTIALASIAHARSGDKGSTSNIGVIAYTAEDYNLICRELTAAKVQRYFAPLGVTEIVRYELPNLWALNFILYRALAEGGSRSLRYDAQGKALGQVILQMQLTGE